MRLFTSLIATAAILLSAGSAFAAANWSVTASTSDGSPLTAVTPGAQLILDIGLTTTGPELLGIAGSVNDYDDSVVAFNSAPVFSATLLNQVCFPTVGCFGGVSNLEGGVRSENGLEGAGREDTFLSVLSVTPAAGDGSLDDPFPQFQLVYDVIGAAGDLNLENNPYAGYMKIKNISVPTQSEVAEYIQIFGANPFESQCQ